MSDLIVKRSATMITNIASAHERRRTRAGDQLNPRPSVVPFCWVRSSRTTNRSSYLSFILGSPSRIHVRLTSPFVTAAFERAVASPIVIGVPLKIIPNTC